MEKHKMCFDSVAVITQLKLEAGGEQLHAVDCDENHHCQKQSTLHALAV